MLPFPLLSSNTHLPTTRCLQVEREWQWKLESREQEVASLAARTRQLEADLAAERQRAASQAHELGDEGKRLAAQCLELQREVEAQGREATRLKVGLVFCVRNGGRDRVGKVWARQQQMAASGPSALTDTPLVRTPATPTGGAQGCAQRQR